MLVYSGGGPRSRGNSHRKWLKNEIWLPKKNNSIFIVSPSLKSKLPTWLKSTRHLPGLLNSRRILPTPPSRHLRISSSLPNLNRQQALLDKAANSVIKVSIVSLLNPIELMKQSRFIPVIVIAVIQGVASRLKNLKFNRLSNLLKTCKGYRISFVRLYLPGMRPSRLG